MSRERFDTVQHRRTGRVHLIEDVEGIAFTLCNHRARRDHYRANGHSMADADCEVCWTVIATRTPPRRRVAEAVA